MGGPDVSHRVLSVPSLAMAVTLARNYSFLSIYGVSPLPARAPLRSLGYISAAVGALTFPSRRFLSGRLPQPNTCWRFSCNGGKLESSRNSVAQGPGLGTAAARPQAPLVDQVIIRTVAQRGERRHTDHQVACQPQTQWSTEGQGQAKMKTGSLLGGVSPFEFCIP